VGTRTLARLLVPTILVLAGCTADVAPAEPTSSHSTVPSPSESGVAPDLWAEHGGGTFRGGGEPNAAGELPQASFVGRALGTVRTVLVPFGDGRTCAMKATYADARAAVLPRAGEPWEAVGVVVDVELPEVEGRYLLCAVRGEAYEDAVAVEFEVDRTPPRLAARADIERREDGAVVVRPRLDPPEISTVRFAWGRAGELDCADLDAMRDSFLAPLTIDPTDLPAVYCIYGLDAAGNRGAVTSLELPAD
jgi:hypothetical protein